MPAIKTESGTYLVKTNGRHYELKSWHDLPEKKKQWFDYVNGDDKHCLRFVCYKRQWYDINEFTSCGRDGTHNHMHMHLPGWEGFQADTFFSGVALRYIPDTNYEVVAMATVYVSSQY